MKLTSSEANKLLKRLNADYQSLTVTEYQSCSFLAATGEHIESVRPEYDFKKTQKEIGAVCAKIRALKHAINVFNSTTVVDGFDMTIDELLVYMPQLSERVSRLDSMRSQLPKLREQTYGTGTNTTIDYRYTNYDQTAAAAEYEKMFELLSKAQHALDLVNNTKVFEVDF